MTDKIMDDRYEDLIEVENPNVIPKFKSLKLRLRFDNYFSSESNKKILEYLLSNPFWIIKEMDSKKGYRDSYVNSNSGETLEIKYNGIGEENIFISANSQVNYDVAA